mgnify:CR=1 FL=1
MEGGRVYLEEEEREDGKEEAELLVTAEGVHGDVECGDEASGDEVRGNFRKGSVRVEKEGEVRSNDLWNAGGQVPVKRVRTVKGGGVC